MVDEAVLWIYGNLRYRLNPEKMFTEHWLVAVAVGAGNRLEVMHQEQLFMKDYRALLEKRCRDFPNLRFSSIPGGKLQFSPRNT